MRGDISKLVQFPIDPSDVLSHTIDLFTFGLGGLSRFNRFGDIDHMSHDSVNLISGIAKRLVDHIQKAFNRRAIASPVP